MDLEMIDMVTGALVALVPVAWVSATWIFRPKDRGPKWPDDDVRDVHVAYNLHDVDTQRVIWRACWITGLLVTALGLQLAY